MSARQWVYGPGLDGVATECEFSVRDGNGSDLTRLLLTRNGNVTKLPGSAVLFDFAPSSQAYAILQRNFSEVVVPIEAAGLQWLQPAEYESLRITTYLSDVLWVVRAARGAAAAVLLRGEAEALRPAMTDRTPDGFDAQRFGASGRRLWMQN